MPTGCLLECPKNGRQAANSRVREPDILGRGRKIGEDSELVRAGFSHGHGTWCRKQVGEGIPSLAESSRRAATYWNNRFHRQSTTFCRKTAIHPALRIIRDRYGLSSAPAGDAVRRDPFGRNMPTEATAQSPRDFLNLVVTVHGWRCRLFGRVAKTILPTILSPSLCETRISASRRDTATRNRFSPLASLRYMQEGRPVNGQHSRGQFREVPQDAQPVRLALLGMELRGKEIVLPNG